MQQNLVSITEDRYSSNERGREIRIYITIPIWIGHIHLIIFISIDDNNFKSAIITNTSEQVFLLSSVMSSSSVSLTIKRVTIE